MHPDDHPRGGGLVEQLLPLIAMSRMGNGNSTWSMVIALCLPLLISSLSVFLIQLRNRLAKVCQTGYTRTIAHTTTNQYWWTSAGDDDQDEEHAPNSIMQRAILTYINTTSPQLALKWQNAEVSARKAVKKKAEDDSSNVVNRHGGYSDDGIGITRTGSDEEDVPTYKYLVAPPENMFVKVAADVELMRVVEQRNSEGGGGGGRGASASERTITFTLRSGRPDGAACVDTFLQAAMDAYNARLRENVDTARYMYVPVLTGASVSGGGGGGDGGPAGGSRGPAALYRRYRLGEARTWASFFHPEKEAVLTLVSAFENKTGKFAIPGYPQKLGFLLHGPPGTGKTSFIKALAHHTRRHIVSIPLSKIKTNQELMDMMHEQNVALQGADESTAPKRLPFSKVIYVMEDVDAASKVVMRRDNTTTATAACVADSSSQPAACTAANVRQASLTFIPPASCADPAAAEPAAGDTPTAAAAGDANPDSHAAQKQCERVEGGEQAGVEAAGEGGGASTSCSTPRSPSPKPAESVSSVTNSSASTTTTTAPASLHPISTSPPPPTAAAHSHTPSPRPHTTSAAAPAGPSAAEMQMMVMATMQQAAAAAAAARSGNGASSGNGNGEGVVGDMAGFEVVGAGAGDSWYKNLLPKNNTSGSEDALNLAGLLNVLDGVVDTPERIIVMTTNHPERLDPALIRPGRINRKIYLGHMLFAEALQMVRHYFEVDHSAAAAATSKIGAAAAAARPADAQGSADTAAAAAAGDTSDLAHQLRAVWVDDVMTPAELECMCAEHEGIATLLEAVQVRCAQLAARKQWQQ